MRLGEKLYRLREKHGLSQDELAEKLNVSRQTISNWENDKVKIDAEKAAQLCILYGVSMDELLLDKQPEQKPQSGSRPKVKLYVLIPAIIICVALIITSAVLLALYEPDQTSSTVSLTVAAGWAVIAVCALVILGIAAYMLIKSLRKK